MALHNTPAPIRSFVRRQGRMTDAQKRALITLWEVYGIEFNDYYLNLDDCFGRRAKRVLEIGFGNGEALLHLAQNHSEIDYLGIEVYAPGIGHLLLKLHQLGLNNVRIIHADASDVLSQQLAAASLSRVHIFFPDPWPKKRHHKRRLIQPDFIDLIAQKLMPGGYLHLATDWQNYAEHMLSVMQTNPAFINISHGFSKHSHERTVTKFERRGRRLGHDVWDLIFQRR